MFGQTFELFDLFRIALLAFLEIVLSADNAIVLGLLASKLPIEKRQRALTAGLVSSLVFRAAALFSLSLLIKFAWIQGLGAIYLIYLATRHLFFPTPPPSKSVHASFWKTVLLIELYDLVFAIDSIIAGVAFISAIPSTGSIHPKLWVVYVGAFIGLIAIRFAAKLFSSLVEKLPRLERTAYLMIAWIGLKLGLNAIEHTWNFPNWFIFEPIFWTVLVLLLIYGLTKRKTT